MGLPRSCCLRSRLTRFFGLWLISLTRQSSTRTTMVACRFWGGGGSAALACAELAEAQTQALRLDPATPDSGHIRHEERIAVQPLLRVLEMQLCPLHSTLRRMAPSIQTCGRESECSAIQTCGREHKVAAPSGRCLADASILSRHQTGGVQSQLQAGGAQSQSAPADGAGSD